MKTISRYKYWQSGQSEPRTPQSREQTKYKLRVNQPRYCSGGDCRDGGGGGGDDDGGGGGGAW